MSRSSVERHFGSWFDFANGTSNEKCLGIKRGFTGNAKTRRCFEIPGTAQSNTTTQPTEVSETVVKQKVQQKSNKTSSATVTSERGVSCHNCKQPHPMYRCQQFLQMSIDQRIERVRALDLCFNCFMTGHRTGNKLCQSGKCRKCGKNHNSLLCKSDLIPVVTSAFVQLPTQQPTHQQIQMQMQPVQQMPVHPYAPMLPQKQLNVAAASWTPSEASNQQQPKNFR